MNLQATVLFRAVVAFVMSLCVGAAQAQQGPDIQKGARSQSTAAASSATLDQMIAAGKSQRDLAHYLFDTHGCKGCHTIGKEGKLGFTAKGKEKAQGFQGCISTLKAMSIIVKVPEDQRSATQRRRVQRFEEFGCATCHKLSPGNIGLTEVGAKLAHLHLGCVDVQKVVIQQHGFTALMPLGKLLSQNTTPQASPMILSRAASTTALASPFARMVRKVDLPTPKQLRSFAVVIIQHPAQALVPLHVTISSEVMRLRADDLVRKALVITFGVVVHDEVVNGCPERLLSEQDHPFQAGFFDASYEAFSVRVQIR